MFTIDWENKQVTCPEGQVSSSWTPARSKGTNIIMARFAKATCQPCPARARCTTAVRSGRQLGFRHRQIHEALTAARAGQASDAWQRKYRIRAGVEGTIAQATHVTGIRRARYLGLGKTRLEHNTAAAAINLIRPRRLVDRQAAGPDPDHPPAAARPRSMKPENMTTN
jgi:hypothetical protein